MPADKIYERFKAKFGDRFSPYPQSIRKVESGFIFMVKGEKGRFLIFAGSSSPGWLEGEKLGELKFNGTELSVRCGQLTHHNLTKLTDFFPSLLPSPVPLKKSFGTGDRLGIATSSHIQAFKGEDIFPILAQQSVRENERTGRSFQEVLDDVMWGCFQAGYEGGFGADADHVKKIEDLKEAVDCGYTMFTVDPSDFVRDKIFKMEEKEKNELYASLPARSKIERRYLDRACTVADRKLQFDQMSLRNIVLCYYEALQHAINCYKFLDEYKQGDFTFEVSVDETPVPTSPLAHVFITEELRRAGVSFQNLALRFVGSWQKGIDYIGDKENFKNELSVHAQIAREFGGYKLSLHSGSDKFSVYPAFARGTKGRFHVKTAGTSYLEAMRAIAEMQPPLYRKIHTFALERFEEDRASYHLTTDPSRIPHIDTLSDSELPSLFDNPDSRQLIHITYGSVLNAKKEGRYLFRDRIYDTLLKNEKRHDDKVSSHIKKHLKLLQA